MARTPTKRKVVKTITEEQWKDFIAELLDVKQMAANLGLWQTYHLLDEAASKAGWEMADIRVNEKESR